MFEEKQLAARLTMMPRDADGLGKISGGVILSQIDLAAAVIARGVCPNMRINRMVTRAMDAIEFKKPVDIGDVLSCYGTVIRTGKTSVTVKIDVEVDRRGKIIPVTEATAVFVALDENDRPTPICPEAANRGTPIQRIQHNNTPSPRPQNISSSSDASSTSLERFIALKKVMMPNETNGMGNIFGGLMLTYMDFAGAYTARKVCTNPEMFYCATRFMDKVEFREAVKVNDVITCYGTITKIGNTSISVHVEVEADRGGKIIKVTQADLVFVAIDKAGKAVSVLPQSTDNSDKDSKNNWSIFNIFAGLKDCFH